MGWMFYDPAYAPKTVAEERAKIVSLLTWNTPESTGECIAAEKVGTVWYCAVRSTAKDHSPYVPDLDGSYTFATIILTDRSGGEWGYKDMTECCGPNAARCPQKVLRLLSPISDGDTVCSAEYARKWRERCRARKAA